MEDFFNKLINENIELRKSLKMINPKSFNGYSIEDKKNCIEEIKKKCVASTSYIGKTIILEYEIENNKKVTLFINCYNRKNIQKQIALEYKNKRIEFQVDELENFKIDIIDKSKNEHIDYFFEYEIVEIISTNKSRNIQKNDKISKKMVEFLIKNIDNNMNEIFDLTEINFDSNIRNNNLIIILLEEIKELKKAINEIKPNLKKKNII